MINIRFWTHGKDGNVVPLPSKLYQFVDDKPFTFPVRSLLCDKRDPHRPFQSIHFWIQAAVR